MKSRHLPFELTIPVSAVDHSLGPEHAPVTVVEYGDFECPNCKQAASAVKLLLVRFERRLRFAFRHFPLEEVHPHALRAAEAAEAAGGQGRFWQMHDALFAHQTHLNSKQIYACAEQIELDMPRFIAEMEDEIYLQRIREHQRSGAESGVHATPTFFVNGCIQDVSYGQQALTVAIDAAFAAHDARSQPRT